MEVKIGITDSPRELVLQSESTPVEVEELVTAALGKDSGVLALTHNWTLSVALVDHEP